MQEEVDEEHNEDKGDAQGDSHLINRGLDVKGRVVRNIDANIGGESRLDLFQLTANPAGDIHRICIRLFNNPETDGGLAAKTGDGIFDFRTNLDRGDVSKTHGGTIALPNDQVGVLLGLVHSAAGKDAQGAALALDFTGGKLHVFSLEKIANIGGGDLARGHFRRIEPDSHRGTLLASKVDSTHSRENLQAVLNLPLGQIGKFQSGSGGAGEGHPHDLLGIGILLGDDGLLNILGKFVSNTADSVSDVLRADIHVTIEFKFDGNGADLLAGLAPENFDSGNVVNLLLHGLGDVCLDEFGIGPRVDGGDRDNRWIDIGQFTNGESGKANDADDRQRQIQHDGGDRAPNTEFGQIHPRGASVCRISFLPGARRRFPERAT